MRTLFFIGMLCLIVWILAKGLPIGVALNKLSWDEYVSKEQKRKERDILLKRAQKLVFPWLLVFFTFSIVMGYLINYFECK